MSGYENFRYEEMGLRDYLAYDRTRLALLRTVLSIGRTALGLLASGAGLVILQEDRTLITLGYVLIGTAAVVLLLGILYYLKFRKRLEGVKLD